LSNVTPLLAANWKMNKTLKQAEEFISVLKKNVADVKGRDIVICPTYTALQAAANLLRGSNIALGGQNMHWEQKGAFTGEISGEMLVDAGCKYVIIGHSERRQYFGETNETVNKKMNAAYRYGLVPIVCVGETLEEREKDLTLKVIQKQINEGIAGLSGENAKKLVVAYEPVWAIGTGRTATPAQAEEVHLKIRELLTVLYTAPVAQGIRILYGGSVKPDNVSELMKQPNINGGLVGGASLEADSFTQLVKFK
jgi:triosephosphate isomerase (TIM)